MIDRDAIRLRWETLGCKFDERGQRLFAANEVRAAGHGALAIVSAITGLARSTINRGEDDLDEGPLPDGRVRRKGGGPKPLSMPPIDASMMKMLFWIVSEKYLSSTVIQSIRLLQDTRL